MTWAHAADRPATRLGKPSTVPGRVEGGGQPVLSFEQCFIYLCILVFHCVQAEVCLTDLAWDYPGV